MSIRKQPTCAATDTQHQNEQPLHPDELLELDNQTAEQELPSEFLECLQNKVLHFSNLDLAPQVTKLDEIDGGWMLECPANSVIGLAGISSERFDKGALTSLVKNENKLKPHRPPWADMTYHPKLSGNPRSERLHRVSGRGVMPFDGVYDNDDRKVFFPSGYPWHCIGRIFTWNDASKSGWTMRGTGALVGRRTVLTAGHMAPWGVEPGRWKILFVPAFFDGDSIIARGFDSWVSDYRGYNSGGGSSAYDMAVLRLYDPLGDRLGNFGVRMYDDDWEDQEVWTLVGYPGSIADGLRPTYQSRIAVLDDDSDGDALEIEHHGDASPGSSGGPFFAQWPDGPYLVGTLSGGQVTSGGFLGIGDEDNNIVAGGKALMDLVGWARQTWV